MCFYPGQWLGEEVGCLFRIRCPNTVITMSTVSTLPFGKSLKLSGKIGGSQTTGSLRCLLASIYCVSKLVVKVKAFWTAKTSPHH